MIKYRTHSGNIYAIEIERETEHKVFLPKEAMKDSRIWSLCNDKISKDSNWHDTWEDAHKFLIEECQNEIDKLHMTLVRKNETLLNITRMINKWRIK
jgi:hypothetical protein